MLHLNFTKYCTCHKKWHLNVTKYCACHEKWLSWLILVTYETSFTMRGATGVIFQRHEMLRLPRKMTLENFKEISRTSWNVIYNAGPIQAWSEHETVSPQPASQPRLLFALTTSIFYWKMQHFALGRSFLISRHAAPATKSDTWTSPNIAPAAKSDTWTSPNTAPAIKSDTSTSRPYDSLLYSSLLYSTLLYSSRLCSTSTLLLRIYSQANLFSYEPNLLRIYSQTNLLSDESILERIYSYESNLLRIYCLTNLISYESILRRIYSQANLVSYESNLLRISSLRNLISYESILLPIYSLTLRVSLPFVYRKFLI